MTRIDRILALYNRLRKSPCTVYQLAEGQDDTKTSTRSIYRDLKEVAKLAETHGERLGPEQDGRYNRQIWKVQPKSDQFPLPADDLDTYYISRAVLPGVFIKQRAESLNRMQEAIRQRVMSSAAVKHHTGLSEQTLTNSHFYENKVTNELDTKLKDILWAIGQHLVLEITALSGDATSVRSLVTLPVEVQPIKMIFHRGCFYVATLQTTDQQVLVFIIDHLTYQIGNSFKRTTKVVKRVNDELRSRFGVTHNTNPNVYTIRLQFSDITGKFVGEQNWHHSQKYERTGDKHILTFECGINRELVGWLFQWMSNVQVLGPPELIELYNQQLALMQKAAGFPAEEPILYSNIFAPDA